jgi:hypothetical protein
MMETTTLREPTRGPLPRVPTKVSIMDWTAYVKPDIKSSHNGEHFGLRHHYDRLTVRGFFSSGFSNRTRRPDVRVGQGMVTGCCRLPRLD